MSAIAISYATPAFADDDTPPTVSVSLRDTLDGILISAGGLRRDAVVLNKLQISGTVQGDAFGLPGFSMHAQVFRFDGASASARIGDIQTADNIDTAPVTRLFEAWAEKKFGNDDRSLAIRAGLIDLNADFDSIQTANLFLSSSHGIGADLSRSGVDGPSIYPVTAAGARVSWIPSKQWTFRLAAFDGVAGNPDRPRALVSEQLRRDDGALLIGQADYHLSDKAKIEAGIWSYTRARAAIGSTGPSTALDRGAYISIEGPVPGLDGWSGWVRAGLADGNAQTVDGYLGLGIVRTAPFRARKNDRAGLAIARASIGDPARLSFALPRAETSVEASYQVALGPTVAIQPDVQYVIHPASDPDTPNALVFGLRLVFTAGFPKKAPATDAADPTVPPDGPQTGSDTPGS